VGCGPRHVNGPSKEVFALSLDNYFRRRQRACAGQSNPLNHPRRVGKPVLLAPHPLLAFQLLVILAIPVRDGRTSPTGGKNLAEQGGEIIVG
jgi:hypothetical protein